MKPHKRRGKEAKLTRQRRALARLGLQASQISNSPSYRQRRIRIEQEISVLRQRTESLY